MTEFRYTGPGFYRRRDSGKAWVGCDLRDGGCNSSYPLLGIVVGGIGIRSWTDTGATSVKCTPHDYDLIGPWVEAEPEKCCNINPDCVPTILEPEPELRLPDGWRLEDILQLESGLYLVTACENTNGVPVVRIGHPDKATAIAAAQAAVDVLAKGGDI